MQVARANCRRHAVAENTFVRMIRSSCRTNTNRARTGADRESDQACLALLSLHTKIKMFLCGYVSP
jgi:hypothetical protein